MTADETKMQAEREEERGGEKWSYMAVLRLSVDYDYVFFKLRLGHFEAVTRALITI